MAISSEHAHQIALKIADDICGRGGIGPEFEAIDEETLAEILQTWADIIAEEPADT